MLEISANADHDLINLALARGLISDSLAGSLRDDRRSRSASVALVEDGHLDASVVRALRTMQRRRTIDLAIDGFQLISKLGTGGMSEVFRALDLVHNRIVAIKVISPRIADDRLFIARFHREARAAAALNHPNIIRCYGMGETKGKPYMVLEYMAGGDASDLARAVGGALTESQTLRIARDCARGLEAVAVHGMVHRDLKPANIFLDGNFLSGTGQAKLADLGLTKGTAHDDQLTMAGVRVGSPGYMSPEQASGRDLDIRSDIYSLGASMYHLLAGHAPYTGKTPMEIILKGLREEPFPLSHLAPHVSGQVLAIVNKCMARNPAHRYQHPSELQRVLAEANGESMVGTKPASGVHVAGEARGPWQRLSTEVTLLKQRVTTWWGGLASLGSLRSPDSSKLALHQQRRTTTFDLAEAGAASHGSRP